MRLPTSLTNLLHGQRSQHARQHGPGCRPSSPHLAPPTLPPPSPCSGSSASNNIDSGLANDALLNSIASKLSTASRPGGSKNSSKASSGGSGALAKGGSQGAGSSGSWGSRQLGVDVKAYLVDFNDVHFKKLIGRGAFGRVSRALPACAHACVCVRACTRFLCVYVRHLHGRETQHERAQVGWSKACMPCAAPGAAPLGSACHT